MSLTAAPVVQERADGGLRDGTTGPQRAPCLHLVRHVPTA